MVRESLHKWSTLMAPARSVSLDNSDNKLSKDDLSRALFCSMAVYKNNAEAEYLLQQAQIAYPSIAFVKVHMSLDLPKGQKFLVAYTENCAFIAFRGTENLQDVACDMRTDRCPKFGGWFHKGFYDRADSFMGPNHSPLPDLLETKKRIFFCGHSLGGAVAHMVLYRFLIDGDQQPLSSETYPDSLISIAFGAPHICDEVAARKINDSKSYKWRFINFVNQSDPVPHMLHHLRSTISAVLRTALIEADSMLQSLGGFAGRCIEGFADGGPTEALLVAGKETRRLVAKGVVNGARKITSRLHDFSNEVDFSEAPKNPDFHPIGQYISLYWDDQGRHWSSSQCYGGDLRIQDLFCGEVKYTNADVELHLINSYRTVLVEVCFIDSPTRRDDSDPLMPSHQLLVSTPTPKVIFAKWLLVEDPDSNQRYIIVKGENLLFLREAVSVTGSNGQEPWNITKQSDNFLMIFDPHRHDLNKGPKDSENAITMVIIKTAFGEISQQTILEYYPNHEGSLTGASRMIGKIVETLMVKATPPLSIRPDSNADVMTGLDNIMHCVPSLKGERVSTKLTQITTFAKTNGDDLETHIKEINFMFKSVVKCLRSCLKVDYDYSMLENMKKRVRSFLQGRPDFTMAERVVGILFLPITLGASLLGVLILGQSKTIIDGYDLVLNSAILESYEWSESSELESTDDQNSCSIDHLEMVLYKKVAGSTPEFQQMVKNAHSMSVKDVPCFKSETFHRATSQSRVKLLKRIKVVCDTISLYNEVVVGTHFIGIFGAEDVGKSSFIKKALKEFGPPGAPSPDTGFGTHTKIVRPYMLKSSLWLVDFPGGNGTERYADMWKQFTALSSSAVLFLDFQGDIKQEQVKMYQKMKKNLGAETEVAVVFNKVDLKFTPRNQTELGTFTFEYFENQRESNRSKLGCSSIDGVHFSCVDPDPPEKLNELKKMGVLGFEELMKVVYPGI
ncbi:hypothetical protein M758_9G070700 [Ceratodon purpureus]|nr:hypothetical protein M758_9G070700 [Ceratodon purpureus]